jgi:hypothetical protein
MIGHMKRFFALAFLLLFPTLETEARPITIAVIDTGFTQAVGFPTPNFCKFGHADFTTEKPVYNKIPRDSHGHGTHVTYLIEQYLKDIPNTEYCIVVIKYWIHGQKASRSVQNTTDSLDRAYQIAVDFINYSSFGSEPAEKEEKIIKKILKTNTKIVTAAGNEGAEIVSDIENELRMLEAKVLKKDPPNITTAYPANYDDKIIVVGNWEKQFVPNPSSNWGSRVNVWEIGTDVVAGGNMMTGTSQATAIHTGKLVRKTILERKTNGN